MLYKKRNKKKKSFKPKPSILSKIQKDPLLFNRDEMTDRLVILHWFINNNVLIPQEITCLVSKYLMDDRIIFWRKNGANDGTKQIRFTTPDTYQGRKELTLYSNGTYEYSFSVVLYPGGWAMCVFRKDEHCGLWSVELGNDENECKVVLNGIGYQNADTTKGHNEKPEDCEQIISTKISINKFCRPSSRQPSWNFVNNESEQQSSF
eukprot:581579_1